MNEIGAGAGAGGAGSMLAAVQPLILGSGAVVLVLAIVFWLLRKRFGPVGPAQVDCRVLATLALGQRERLAVVRVDNRRLVLGVTAGSVQCLCELSEAPDAPVTNVRGWGASLAEAIQRSRAS